jgi:DNA-binding transcriptional LysR family regulator
MKKASIAEMSAFVVIAERASFAKAAKQLGVSRSSLSESLRSLEERLGVRLINRTTRSVAVTEAGERLLVQLRPLLDNFDAALESVNAFRDSPAVICGSPCRARRRAPSSNRCSRASLWLTPP